MRRRDLFAAVPAALGILGAALTLLRESAYGPGLGLDSIGYLSIAKNLTTGNGFTIWNGHAYYGCPFFSIVLAAAGLFGLDGVETAGYVNAAAFGLTVFATAMWLHSRVRSRFLAIWAGCACVLSLQLADLAAVIWTDMLFILLVVLSLFALDRFLASGERWYLPAAASWAALACSTRHIGLALIAAALPLLLLRRGAALPARIKNAAAYAAVAAMPFCAWTAKGLVQKGLLVDKSTPTNFTLLGSLHETSGEFVLWILREQGLAHLNAWSEQLFGIAVLGTPTAAGVSLKLALLLALAAAAGYALVRLRRAGYLQDWRILTVPAAFLAVYALFLAILLPLFDVQMPPRYLAPLYPPALVAAGLILNELLRCAADRRKRRSWLPARMSLPALALQLCLILWLAPQARANYDDIRLWMTSVRHHYRQWSNSETIRYMNARSSPDVRIWNNAPDWLPTLTQAQAGVYLWLMPKNLPGQVEQWAAATDADGKETYVVWFHGIAGHSYGIADLAVLPGLEVEAVLEDGIVFRGNMDAADRAAPADAPIEALLQNARPVIRAGFDIYLDASKNRLIYVKEECAGGNTRAPFFLHVFPVDKAELIHFRKGHGFDSFGFRFDDFGFTAAGRCAIVQNLPDYAIAEIKSGQWIRGQGNIWEGIYRFGRPAE